MADSQILIAVPFAVGIPDEQAKGLLDVLAQLGLGATNGPQGAGNVMVLVTQQADIGIPDNVLAELQAAINAATQAKPASAVASLGTANPIITQPAPALPEGVTPTTDDQSYRFVGSFPAYSNLCLSWCQDQLGVAHEYPTAIDAWFGYSARGLRTDTPAQNDMAFFEAAPVNGNDGHVGLFSPPDRFVSVWSNGNEMDAPIRRFAADNGAPFLGYISTARLRQAQG